MKTKAQTELGRREARRVVEHVAKAMRLPVRALWISHGRAEPAASARKVAVWILRADYGLSYAEIGRLLGRNMSTIRDILKHGEPLAEVMAAVRTSLSGGTAPVAVLSEPTPAASVWTAAETWTSPNREYRLPFYFIASEVTAVTQLGHALLLTGRGWSDTVEVVDTPEVRAALRLPPQQP